MSPVAPATTLNAQPVFFDPARNAWILSRYADVRAALAAPQLVVHGTPRMADGATIAERSRVAEHVSQDLLTRWRPDLQHDAERRLDALEHDRPVDLVARFFAPWSADVARRVNGVSSATVDECLSLARTVFLAAAHATDGAPSATATEAAATLAARLSAHAPASPMGTVQAWVALTQSLPATLAGIWLALLTHPEQMERLRASLATHDPVQAMSRAIAELLRFAGPAQAVFRTAHDDVTIGDVNMRTNDRVILLLSAANRDPAYLPDAHALDLTRTTAAPHLALGAGPRRCPGAALVRMATAIATEALLRRTPRVPPGCESLNTEAWTGGFAIRAPAVVMATLGDGAAR